MFQSGLLLPYFLLLLTEEDELESLFRSFFCLDLRLDLDLSLEFDLDPDPFDLLLWSTFLPYSTFLYLSYLSFFR